MTPAGHERLNHHVTDGPDVLGQVRQLDPGAAGALLNREDGHGIREVAGGTPVIGS